LTNITIPDSVTSLGDQTFYDCTNLTSITIPGSVPNIGWEEFEGCNSLTNIIFLGNAPSVDPSAFDFLGYANATVWHWQGTTNWSTVFGGVPTAQCGTITTNNDGTVTIARYTGPGGAVTIPSAINGRPVTGIGASAFQLCTSLTGIALPNSVTSIGASAFYGCHRLNSITFPGGVASIGSDAFFDCNSLINITLPGSITSIGSGAFQNCIILTNVYFLGNSPQPTNDSSVFSGDSNASVYYQPGTTGWATYFDNLPAMLCYRYTINNGKVTITQYYGPGGAVTIPGTIASLPVTSIVDSLFSGWTNLTSVTIPNSVTNIGNNAFQYCTSLASVTMGTGVTSIGYYAFYGCTSLTNVTIPNSVASIGVEAFFECPNLATVTIGTSVTSIGQNAFCGCDLTSVTIPNSVTSIGNGVFGDCPSLTSVTIGNHVTSLGSDAFQNCPSLASVYFQGNAPSADSSVFSGDNNPTAYYLPGTTGWGAATFGGLPAVLVNPPYLCTTANGTITISGYTGPGGTVTITNTINGLPVTGIGTNAFYGCTSLTNVTIPSSVTNLAQGAFWECTGVANVTIGTNVTRIGNWAFSYCTSLTSVSIPGSVTSIGDWAFGWCCDLTSVTLPTSVTSIGDQAFSQCTSLAGVYCKGNPASADAYVFNNDNNPTVYYLPGTTGWGVPGTLFGGRPTALWNPPTATAPKLGGITFTAGGGGGCSFCFTNAPSCGFSVYASTNLMTPFSNWPVVGQMTETANGSYSQYQFTDSQASNKVQRFYRVSSP
jgi:hypothetical protein